MYVYMHIVYLYILYNIDIVCITYMLICIYNMILYIKLYKDWRSGLYMCKYMYRKTIKQRKAVQFTTRKHRIGT